MPRYGSRSLSPARLALTLPAILFSGALAPNAFASPPPLDVQTARELFGKAEADEDAGRWEAALDKLREVATVRDTAGVRYHLALCEEQLGKLVAARTDYAAADVQAHVEQARDVLRVVEKKRADLEHRIARLTVRVLPDAADAVLSIDGQPATAGGSTPVDPGSHRVEVTAQGRATPAVVTLTLGEGEGRTIDVALPPPAIVEAQPPEPPPEPRRGPRSPELPDRPSRTEALLAAGGALALAGGGFAAYAAADAAREQATRSCAQIASMSAASCDAYRVPVRAWDWTAIGAWAAAGAMATWAAVTWVRAPGAPARLVVGAGSVQVTGGF
jgi:hypothetical protein